MGESVGTRQLNFQIGPRPNQIAYINVTNTPSGLILPAEAARRYITIQNDSAATNLYFQITGSASAPAMTPGTQGGFGAPGMCAVIFPMQEKRIEIQPGVDRAIWGITTTGTAGMRVYYSSNQEGYALGNPPGQA